MTAKEVIDQYNKQDVTNLVVVMRKGTNDLTIMTTTHKYIYTGNFDKDEWRLAQTIAYEESEY